MGADLFLDPPRCPKCKRRECVCTFVKKWKDAPEDWVWSVEFNLPKRPN